MQTPQDGRSGEIGSVCEETAIDEPAISEHGDAVGGKLARRGRTRKNGVAQGHPGVRRVGIRQDKGNPKAFIECRKDKDLFEISNDGFPTAEHLVNRVMQRLWRVFGPEDPSSKWCHRPVAMIAKDISAAGSTPMATASTPGTKCSQTCRPAR